MVKVKQLTSAQIEIIAPGQEMVIDNEQGPAMLQALVSQAAGQIRIELGGAYRLDNETEKAALELAGLSGFAAAKQTSKGYISL